VRKTTIAVSLITAAFDKLMLVHVTTPFLVGSVTTRSLLQGWLLAAFVARNTYRRSYDTLQAAGEDMR
jgi:hypothetical protein